MESRIFEEQVAEEPRDRTAWIWMGVVVAVVAMVAALWLTQEPSAGTSLVKAQHILIAADMNNPAERAQALERAKELRQQILKGASFSQLARDNSNDPFSSQRGGDLGWQPPGTFEDAFERYVWSPDTKVGEVGDIVRTNRGFHIIKVNARKLSKTDQYERDLQLKTQKGTGAPESAEGAASGS